MKKNFYVVSGQTSIVQGYFCLNDPRATNYYVTSTFYIFCLNLGPILKWLVELPTLLIILMILFDHA